MSTVQQYAKRVLNNIGLYELAHRVWINRPDVRLALYNFGYRLAGPSDGLPIPPTRLIKLVQIDSEIAIYLWGGMRGKNSIINVLCCKDQLTQDILTDGYYRPIL